MGHGEPARQGSSILCRQKSGYKPIQSLHRSLEGGGARRPEALVIEIVRETKVELNLNCFHFKGRSLKFLCT